VRFDLYLHVAAPLGWMLTRIAVAIRLPRFVT